MTTKIKKWGNSYGIVLPKMALNQLNLDENSNIAIKVENFKIIIERVEKKITLEDMMRDFDPKTRHEETDWGPDVGKEIVIYER
jgi:antitoxin MazE